MKITICGSMIFYKKFKELKYQLEDIGHTVYIPELEPEMEEGILFVKDSLQNKSQLWADLKWLWKKKNEEILKHFKAIEIGDCILVANYEKKWILGYIGINAMLEMGIAAYLEKPIYLLDEIPSQVDRMDEIQGMMPIVINFDLKKI